MHFALWKYLTQEEKHREEQVVRRWVRGMKWCASNTNKGKRLGTAELVEGELLTDHEVL